MPYRGGGQAINDLIAGHIKIASLGSSPLIPHYKAGTLRLLAQSTQARSPSLPDVPTYQEAGIKGLVLDQWLGVFVPAGTPPAIVARLNAEINRALAEATSARASCNRRRSRSADTQAEFARTRAAKISRNTAAGEGAEHQGQLSSAQDDGWTCDV